MAKHTRTKMIYSGYSREHDITFILVDKWVDDEVVSTTVTGFYFGEPDEKLTTKYNGKATAHFGRVPLFRRLRYQLQVIEEKFYSRFVS